MQTWHVSVEFVGTTAFDEDAPFDIAEQLGAYDAVMSVSSDFTSGSALLTIDAPTALEASTEASRLTVDALRASEVEAEVVSLRTQRHDAFEADLLTPIFPEVVGYAEIAEMAHVTRQRARQFAQTSTFPEPVIETAQGPLMAKAAVTRWLETRNTRSGRPRKLAATA
ncbi:hypothetical protein [Microbacterium luteum]|uniref:hypothetical protein n=1 Tax=Microbacterium luteum TaxID=2782167 RepID=UPI0018895BFE|nr:hypothetical protein [Microbacterium luteum]